MDTDAFITKIHINQSRNITDFTIPLSENERKRLIITGKNGTGKTSLLLDLIIFFERIGKVGYEDFVQKDWAIHTLKKRIKELSSMPELDRKQASDLRQLEKSFEHTYEAYLKKFGGTEVYFRRANEFTKKISSGKYLFAFFGARRQALFHAASGIKPLNLKGKYGTSENANAEFIQYIVNLKADSSFARDDGEIETVARIDNWFERLENRLKEIFDSPNLRLKFDRRKYDFEIIEEGKLPYNFNTLSGGYSAILNIVAELIIRMEGQYLKSYDLEGVVLIDEIETHLHVDLQKKILPFLIDFFPKIQFIVTTHSPLVLSSVSNAVICDLEKRIVTTDLSGYSYDALIESYFDSDKYSDLLKKYIEEYEELTGAENLTDEQKDRLFELKTYLREIPKFVSDELAVKLQEIKLKERSKKRKNDLPY